MWGAEVPYTRIIEHKHFEFGTQPVTYITKEYPQEWQPGQEAYYPVNDQRNQDLYAEYAELASREENLLLGGRLALYKYFDMDKIVELALEAVKKEIAGWNFLAGYCNWLRKIRKQFVGGTQR